MLITNLCTEILLPEIACEQVQQSTFVYCDLYRIDDKYNIKVADFGLSEDVYAKNYFRQDKFDNSVKLPFKWMALESLHDCIFTEKTDMVC